ncbi:hypothetical protein CIHG_00682 [Coccidioides immitis H538.4]|uniref:Uncharacterized protein n=3 Tax=Coccidioides immitis TaxID=5501 RepID=A0A0J8QNL5_COCIT|nr:hypothetical protein CIRG_03101 [Coccidioides immitis RMSCC 2394]KMU73950.1 hypothetical protein CISG_03928 [Coccidioides immitis RMSCC 3703]KMU82899.1 hypothetical protein CIHG_00682 [Coccidioides immitis H538.4]
MHQIHPLKGNMGIGSVYIIVRLPQVLMENCCGRAHCISLGRISWDMELPLCLIPPDLMVYNPSSDRAYIPFCVGIFLESASMSLFRPSINAPENFSMKAQAIIKMHDGGVFPKFAQLRSVSMDGKCLNDTITPDFVSVFQGWE